MKKAISIYFISLTLAPLIAFLLRELVDIKFDWFYGLLGTILAIIFLNSTRERIVFPLYLAFGLGFLIISISWDIYYSVVNNELFLEKIYKNEHLHALSLLILIVNVRLDKKEYDIILLLLKITIVIAFIFTLIQLFYDPFFFSPRSLLKYANRASYNIRYTSCFAYVSMHAIGLAFIPILATVISESIKSKDKLLYLWIILGGIVAVTNNSRYIQLNFIIITFILVLQGKIPFLRYCLYALSFLLLIYLTLTLFNFNIHEYIQYRLLSNSALTRIVGWEVFKELFPKRPFLGTGDDLTREVLLLLRGRSSQIHIGYLSALYTYGIIGCVFLFGFWITLLISLYRDAKRLNTYGAFMGMLTFLIANLVLVTFTLYHYGLLLAFLIHQFRSKNN